MAICTARMLSICTGGGGLDLGVRLAEPDCRTVCYVEREAFAVAHLVASMETGGWIARLYGAILPPSTAALGVEQWIGSLAVSHASPIPTPASGKANPTIETCGPIPPESSGKSDPALSFWKTFQESQGITTSQSGQSYDQWITELRKAYSRRLKLARPTNGNDSLSWPTPVTQEGPNAHSHLAGGGFRNTVEASEGLWASPAANNSASDVGTWNGRYYRRENGVKVNTTLAPQVAHWPTPMAADSEKGDCRYPRGNKASGAEARAWPTPLASDANKRGGHENYKPDSRLAYKANSWMTPMAVDGTETKYMGKKRISPTLAYQVRCQPFPLDRLNIPPGHTCSTKCRRLNPLFAEMLMGWPIGWSLQAIAGGALPLSAMGLYPWWPLMRSTLWQLIYPGGEHEATIRRPDYNEDLE